MTMKALLPTVSVLPCCHVDILAWRLVATTPFYHYDGFLHSLRDFNLFHFDS